MGQDLRADDLLLSAASEIQLVLPSVCIIEAMSAFDWKRRERNELKQELDRQLTQLRRSRNIGHALQLASELTKADLTNAELLSELFHRLDDYLMRLALRADLIPVSAAIIQEGVLLLPKTELDRADALILASILEHSKSQTTTKKAFLTGNVNDFNKHAVRDILAREGVRLFASTERALGWAHAITD
jgi:hypothetical protein